MKKVFFFSRYPICLLNFETQTFAQFGYFAKTGQIDMDIYSLHTHTHFFCFYLYILSKLLHVLKLIPLSKMHVTNKAYLVNVHYSVFFIIIASEKL